MKRLEASKCANWISWDKYILAASLIAVETFGNLPSRNTKFVSVHLTFVHTKFRLPT